MTEQPAIENQPEETVPVPKSLLEAMVKQGEETRIETEILYNTCISIMALLGLVDSDGRVKSEVLSGEESWLPCVLKGAKDIVSLLLQMKIPGIGKKAEAELIEKFKFLKEVMPLVEKYGKQNQTQHTDEPKQIG